MLDHVSFGVADLERAATFYDAVLGALGWTRTFTHGRCVGYGLPGAKDELFAILASGADARSPGLGCHLAFAAPTREAVVAFHAAALSVGGVDEGAPGLRPACGPDYFAAFIRDLDGYRIEAVSRAPA